MIAGGKAAAGIAKAPWRAQGSHYFTDRDCPDRRQVRGCLAGIHATVSVNFGGVVIGDKYRPAPSGMAQLVRDEAGLGVVSQGDAKNVKCRAVPGWLDPRFEDRSCPTPASQIEQKLAADDDKCTHRRERSNVGKHCLPVQGHAADITPVRTARSTAALMDPFCQTVAPRPVCLRGRSAPNLPGLSAPAFSSTARRGASRALKAVPGRRGRRAWAVHPPAGPAINPTCRPAPHQLGARP